MKEEIKTGYKATDKNIQGLAAKQIWAQDVWTVDECRRKGVNLLQIWESEWNQKKEEIKINILRYLGNAK